MRRHSHEPAIKAYLFGIVGLFREKLLHEETKRTIMKKNFSQLWNGLVITILTALLGGCGSLAWDSTNLTTGDVGVDVSYATAPGCKNVWITVKQVWIHTGQDKEITDSGWQKLDFSAKPLTINLSDPALGIDGGGTGVAQLVDRLSVPAADYYQVRLFLASTEDPLESSAKAKSLTYNNQVDDIDPGTNAITSRPLRIPAASQGISIVRDAKSPIVVQAGSYSRYAINFNLARDLVKTDRENTGIYEYILKPQPLIINMADVGGIKGSLKTFANMSGAKYGYVIKVVQAGNEVLSCTPNGINADNNLAFSLYPLPATKDTYDVVIQGRKTDTFLIHNIAVNAKSFAALDPVPIVNGSEYPINFTVKPTGASLSFSRTSSFSSLGSSCAGCHTGQVSVTETYHLDPFNGKFATPLFLSSNPPHIKTFSEKDFKYFAHADNNGAYKVVANALFHTPSTEMDITAANAGQTLNSIPPLTLDTAQSVAVQGTISLGAGAPTAMNKGYVLATHSGMIIDRVEADMSGAGSYSPFTLPAGRFDSYYGLYALGWNNSSSKAAGIMSIDLRKSVTPSSKVDITMLPAN